MDSLTASLKSALEVPTTAYLWGERHQVTPAVCSKTIGDGRGLLALTPLNTRPNYYVVRVDSRWGEGDIHDHIDDIYNAIEDEYGPAYDEEEGRGRPWPAADFDAGSSWHFVAWPKMLKTQFEAVDAGVLTLVQVMLPFLEVGQHEGSPTVSEVIARRLPELGNGALARALTSGK